MARELNDFIASLPEEEQKAIEQEFQIMQAEYLTLQDLRKAQKLSQQELAEKLNIEQGNLSRMERQTDAMISTVRKYVEAMGGEFGMFVEFPNRKRVEFKGFSETIGDQSGVYTQK